MDSTRHPPAARRLTTWKVTVLCGSAVLTAATWLASGPPVCIAFLLLPSWARE